MRSTSILLALAVFSFAAAAPERGAPLARSVMLGVRAAAAPGGVKVDAVLPGGTAAAAGIAQGDIIQTVNGKTTDSPAALVASVRGLHAGDKINLTLTRDGKPMKMGVAGVGRPFVTEPDLDVLYDQVVSDGQRVRVIVTRPKKAGKFPVLMLIGGIGAYSLDSPFATMLYGKEIGPLAQRDIITVRIDKPGQGDSEGPEYKDLGFNQERDAYVAALRLTKSYDFVNKDHITIFGHSMGGSFAPLVASVEPVENVVVSGTLFQSFPEYLLENSRRQAELAGASAVEIDNAQREATRGFTYVYGEKMATTEVIKAHPDLKEFVESSFGPGETYSGVGRKFFTELWHTNLPEAWSKVRAKVTAIYCENDFLSDQRDHERIVNYVNSLHPNSAKLIVLKNSDHGFTQTTSQRDSMERWGQPGGVHNDSIVSTLADILGVGKPR